MKKKKSKKNFLSKFLFTIIVITLILLLFFICLSVTYIYLQTNSMKNQSTLNENETKTLNSITNRHLNFLVFGLDEGEERTDSIIIGTIDSYDNSIDIISIYRDTYIELLPHNIDKLTSYGYYVPKDGVMKINQIHHYGHEYGSEMLIEQIEYEFNISLDYYAGISLDAFKYIIDEIGGITFYVPQRMYYVDPYQDLYIDLYEGEQVLNGEQSEGLMRYRKGSSKSYGYSRGDIDRVNVQQDFIQETIKQVLNKNTIISNLDTIILTAIKYVDTNVTLLNVPQIIPYLLILDSNNINMYTLPITESKINEQSYVILSNGYEDVINEIFYDSVE